VHWNFNGSIENESTLRPLCEQVDRHFPLAADRHYCYFALPNDPVDDEYLAGKIGEYFRGLQVSASGTDEVCRYLRDRCFPLGTKHQYDNLIYIRHSTCHDQTGCVITYAHELQHSAQESRFPKLMAANRVLRGNLLNFEPEATEIDLPYEVDANIVSKRIAEEICGVEAVRKFAEEQVRDMAIAGATAQEARWRFFLNLPSYDWVRKTLELVKKYTGLMHFGMDVHTEGWWKGN
jgi:hypothetical protein